MRADSGGVGIAYEVVGDGPPVLLMQGLGYPRWGWEPVVVPLSQRFTVVYYDNRGIGESDVPAGPYTTRQLAEDGVAVLDAAGIERTHVIGTSLGGMAAQELAAAFPERVDRLVLACTSPGDGAVPMPERTVALMAEAATLAPEVALRRFVANALAPDADAALVEEIYGRRLASPPNPQGWQAQAAAGAAFAGVEGIVAPTLIVHGSEDAVIDVGNAHLLAERIRDARVETLDGRGHLFFWEDPQRFVRLVTEFLS